VTAFREVAEPIADLLGQMPYHVIQTLIDPLWEKGIHAYFKATNLARLDDGLIERLCDVHLAAPGPQCEMHVHQMGGAVGRVADDATAFADRSVPFVLNAVTGWHDPAAGPAHREWARSVIDAASDASTGRAYVNFLGDADAAQSSYGDATYRALPAEERLRPDERLSAQPEHRAAGDGCHQDRTRPRPPARRRRRSRPALSRAGDEPGRLGPSPRGSVDGVRDHTHTTTGGSG
jgi:hypothetical protein